MLALIAALQYATSATFLVIGLAAYRYGAAGQRAAEAEVIRQGFQPEILARHKVRVEESLTELMFPLGIALLFAVLATLNLVTADIGRLATWIAQPILFVAGGYITGAQVFVVRLVGAGLRKSKDPDAQAIDAKRVMDAASAAFPVWLRPLIVIRFVLVTLGSALILLMLAAAESGGQARQDTSSSATSCGALYAFLMPTPHLPNRSLT